MQHIRSRRVLCLLTALALTVSLLSGLSLTAFADTLIGTPTGYTDAAQVVYDNSGSYLKNWGARGETASFLSSYAQNYYTGSYTYARLSANAGSSSAGSYTTSALYNALHSMLSAKQTSTTSYDGTRSMYCYTDCVNNNSSYISSFYSGTRLNGAWDSGATWNREHTWPQSKSTGSQLNDIMMLRPTAVSENSARGNKAYGESSGYYHPNSEAGSTGLDLRGDCARVTLYCYVRWSENAESMWGADGVMESVDVLLSWMQQDPVDTWEMGRNDAVQSITGVRNCFVDYPELAFLLFGRDIPANYATPSNGEGGGEAPSTVTLTYMANGSVCGTASGYAGDSVTLPASAPDVADWSFIGWVETAVAETDVSPAFYAPGAAYVPSASATLYALYAQNSGGSAASNDYALFTGTLAEGDYLVVYNSKAMKGSLTSGNRIDYNTITVSNDLITTDDASLVWTLSSETVSGTSYWRFCNKSTGTYAAATSTNNRATLQASVNDYARWSVTESNGTYDFQNKQTSRYLRNNGTYGFAAYSTSTGGPLSLYRNVSAENTVYTTKPGGTDYTVSFTTPDGITAPAPMTVNSVTGAELPTAEAPEGYSFLGWVTEDYDHVTELPAQILSGLYKPQADITLKALYTYEDDSPRLKLMTVNDTFSNGDKIVIVDSTDTYGLYQQTSTINTGYASYFDFTNDAAVILADARKYFDVTQADGGWWLGDETNGWLYTPDNTERLSIRNNTAFMTAFELTTYEGYLALQHTVSYNTNLFYLNCCTSTNGNLKNLWCMVNSSSMTGTSTLHIYKLDEGGTAVTYYTTLIDLPHEHTPAEAVIENNVDPTCTKAGSYDNVVYCAECGKELSRETVAVPALGHQPKAAVAENNVAPSCTEAGSYDNVVYCERCGEELSRETVTVPALGHQPKEAVTENNVAPTCTEAGSYDSVVYCQRCDAEISRETVSVDALGHNPGEPVEENRVEPTATTDGGYDSVIYCTRCGAELSREHTTIPATGPAEPVLDESIVLYNSIGIGIEIQTTFGVRKSVTDRFESWYIEVSKLDASGNITETKRFGAGQEGAVSEGYIREAVYTDITAKEMGVRYAASFHGFAADGSETYSNTVTNTVRDYVIEELLKTDNDDATRRLAADLLNYGAAAQVYFNFDAENLVNANLSAEAQAAMEQFADVGEAPATLENGSNGPNVYGSVSVMNRVVLSLTVRGLGTPSQVQILVKNHETGEVKATLDTVKRGTVWMADYAGFEAEDMRTAFDFVPVADGTETGTPLTWSVEGYAKQARQNEDASEAELALFNALLHYVDAAAAAYGN